MTSSARKVAIVTDASQGFGRKRSALQPLGRMGEVSDIVNGVLYLENAPFATGEILHVDGGRSAGH